VKRQIVAARILTAAGRTLASYRRAIRAAFPSARAHAPTACGLNPTGWLRFKSVMLDGAKLGTCIWNRTSSSSTPRLRRFAWIMAAILLGAWLLGLALASRLQG
jgi:hypothetical protein